MTPQEQARYTMLIVDDEHEIREGLRQADYSPCLIEVAAVCENGIEALKFMAQQPVDILLTDIKMPLMDGLELISKVSALYPYTKKIVLSGYGDFEYAKKGIEFGVLDYLLKPLDFNEYFQVLQKTAALLGQEREQQVRQAGLERKAKLSSRRLREKFLGELLQQPLAVDMIELDSAAAEVLLEINAPYAVGVLRFPSYPEKPRSADRTDWQLVVFALDNLLHDYWDEAGFGYHYVDSATGQCSLIVTDPELLAANQEEANGRIGAELERILKGFKRFRGLFQANLSYRIGNRVDHVTQIYHSCQSAEAGFALREADRGIQPHASDGSPDGLPEAKPGTAAAGSRRLIHEAKSFIAGHYDRTITLDDVAQHVHLNASYLSHLFKEITGKKYIDYLTEFRLEKARELLTETNGKIYEISEMVGYENPRYFTLIFKKHFGQSPLEYRNAHYQLTAKDG